MMEYLTCLRWPWPTNLNLGLAQNWIKIKPRLLIGSFRPVRDLDIDFNADEDQDLNSLGAITAWLIINTDVRSPYTNIGYSKYESRSTLVREKTAHNGKKPTLMEGEACYTNRSTY